MMKHWTEMEDLNKRTVYVNLDEVQVVLPWGETQSQVVLSNCKLYINLRPAQVIQMMNQMLGA